MLFHEAYAVATQELKTMAERPDEAGPRRLSQPERAERYRKIKASVSGIDIKDRNEPPDALLDLCISIYEGNRLRYVSWDRCTSKSQELSSEANRDNMLTVDPQGRLKGLALEMANLLVSFAQLEAADHKFFQELADRTRVGFQSSSAGIPLDSCFEEVFNLPEVTHIMQPLPKAAGGRIDPPPRRPHPYEQPAKGGAREARDQGKELLGCRACTSRGDPICFGYGSKTCTEQVKGGRCPKGLHVCAVPTCGGRTPGIRLPAPRFCAQGQFLTRCES